MDHMVAADSAHVHTQDREPVRKIIDWYSILEKYAAALSARERSTHPSLRFPYIV
jgi:hypothetical protein